MIELNNKNMPRSRISNWHYVYVLESLKDEDFYIGYTTNPTVRLKQHNAKKSFSTKSRTPFKYIYMEVCLNEIDAKRREDYLKTTQGGRFLKIRLREFLQDNNTDFVEKLSLKFTTGSPRREF